MIETAIDRGQKHPMTLFYASLTLKDLAFHQVIEEFAKRNDNFKYVPILSKEESSEWNGLREG